MQPYFERDRIQIFHGDSRELLPGLAADVVITDPVWPNSVPTLRGAERPYELFAEVAALLPDVTRRLVVQLGCMSDPRFLRGVPAALPFIRTCWLEYACPSYAGRVLNTGDVAYAFGDPPPAKPGRVVLPGKSTSTRADHHTRGNGRNKERTGRVLPHPTPRRLQHVNWLVRWFANGLVLDPFAGSGTTLVAARAAGYPAVGIEIEERFCEVAARRLDQGILEMPEEVA